MILKRFARPGWLFFFAILGYGVYMAIQLGLTYTSAKSDTDRIRHIVASEELILQLNAELKKLSKGVANLRLPDVVSSDVFDARVQVADLGDELPTSIDAELSIAAVWKGWSIGSSVDSNSENLTLWQPLIDQISYFRDSKFYFVRGEFSDESMSQFVSDVGFKGLAKLNDGKWAGVKAKQQLTWVRTDETNVWKIARWQQEELKTIESSDLLFTEVLEQALPSRVQLDQARNSMHQKAVVNFYRNGGQLPWDYFAPISANQRPGISVVDINNDGFDDFYVVVRRGPNQLYVNQGNGTFKESASSWGLDVRNYSSAGIFADFDNDGDDDLMLGRSIEQSLYLENTGERFVMRNAMLSGDLPRLVVSMSAVDYNRDGLLDIYFSTYRPAVLESIVSTESHAQAEKKDTVDRDEADGDDFDLAAGAGLEGIAEKSKRWTEKFLSKAEMEEYEKRLAEARGGQDRFSSILNQVGPPNVLLVNRGNGKFEVAPESPQLAVWRNTLQATWADFDDDGDPDLYVANDWAKDNLLINNGGSFQDVTDDFGITEFGFAMGVSWGDYNRDGYQDIYVSNMFSKAGRRITSQIAELDPSYGRSVDGNYLYQGSNDGFKLVSGLESPGIPVAEAGWSWGGQFADFDNDGFLDLYVLSGYFTAPDEFASDVDL